MPNKSSGMKQKKTFRVLDDVAAALTSGATLMVALKGEK
jgi:hypothetical protein